METTYPCNSNSVGTLNGAAVVSLMEGKYLECMQSLQGALQSIKHALGHANGELRERRTSRSSSAMATRSVAVPGPPGAFEVFNRAFVFGDADCSLEEALTGEERHIVPAMLLYNMGFCQHLQALRQGSSEGLKTAYRSYSNALAFLEAISNDLSDSDMILVAALANNMASISSQFFDVENTRIFRQILEDILDTCAGMGGCEEDEARVFFAMNLLFASELQWHSLAPAA